MRHVMACIQLNGAYMDVMHKAKETSNKYRQLDK
ncbi:MAG: hypothetical protein H6Q14_147 [Bacteroidetes bacterium]|nr:hypothetical protein [Bacteroidota bacterium]